MSVAGILIGGTFAFIGLAVCADCATPAMLRAAVSGRERHGVQPTPTSRVPTRPLSSPRAHAQFATAVGIYFAFRGKRLTKDEAQISCTNNIVIWFCAWLMWLCTWLHQWHPIIFPLDVRVRVRGGGGGRWSAQRPGLRAASCARAAAPTAAPAPLPANRRLPASPPLAARRWPTRMLTLHPRLHMAARQSRRRAAAPPGTEAHSRAGARMARRPATAAASAGPRVMSPLPVLEAKREAPGLCCAAAESRRVH